MVNTTATQPVAQDVATYAEEDFETDFAGESNTTDASYFYVNETGEQDDYMETALSQGRTEDGRPIRDEIASAIGNWSRQMSGSLNNGSMFFRNRYNLTSNVYDQMVQCSDAVEYDDVLSSVGESTEGLAFSRLSMEAIDPDQEDLWNQVAEDLNLETRIREMWRELYKCSQFYVAIDWQQKTYRVRNNSIPQASQDTEPVQPVPGAEDLDPTGLPKPAPAVKASRKRRKQFAVTVPGALTILDPGKVLPVGQLMFGHERFAYIASPLEDESFRAIFEGKGSDPTVLKMFDGPYTPTIKELAYITQGTSSGRSGSDIEDYPFGRDNHVNLWLFKKDVIFRHTLTRAQYERFASVRLKSALPLLDMKANLRASDRAALIGATNFIIVLKRGSDKYPARPGEVDQLREQAKVVARMPILVGDHRLSVEIVTPSTDNVLKPDRYDTIDRRLIMIALHSFRLAQGGSESRTASNDDDQIARGIEARRASLSRSVSDALLRATVKKNQGIIDEIPSIAYHPKRVMITLDPKMQALIIQLRQSGDISRETELDEFNLDQEIEYERRKREKNVDDVFQSSVPFSSPETNPFATGTQGGRPLGGGGAGMPSTPAAGNPSGPVPTN
jgi:hypothetical protein